MKIAMVGLGYIGLPNALLLARAGHKVLGVDIRKDVIDMLKKGKLPFEENGLNQLLNDAKKNFKPSTHLAHSDCYIIAVPTPLDNEMKMADLKAVKSAAEAISGVIRDNDLVILESTVPPGTSLNYVIPILKKNGIKKIYYAHCPERAIPGKTLTEMCKNDRIIGGVDKDSISRAKRIYSTFVKGNLIETDVTTAEYVKLMENTYRDINIALANEFALIAEDLGVNVWEAIALANKHPRVNILKPGPGVGGHCIAIDPLFMLAKTQKAKIIPIAREINDLMAYHVISLAKGLLKGIDNPKITILGMAYKGNVDDFRESPTFKIAKIAENEGITVTIHDPLIGSIHGNIRDLKTATKNTDLLVLSTDHDCFKEIDPKDLAVKHRNLIDTRNMLDHTLWKNAGYRILILGNGKVR